MLASKRDIQMSQLKLFKENGSFLSLKEASIWASQYLNRKISVSNISYLIQYGRIKKYGNEKGVLINIEELKEYYKSNEITLRKNANVENINWSLSFSEYKESERTKHVHRLHPYKGKFIPQLVEYFLDSHIDKYKRDVFFKDYDIVLDPFCGSGTTLVQANELKIHAIGIDISSFNSMISNVKVGKYNISELRKAMNEITLKLEKFQKSRNNTDFENHLFWELSKFNQKYFPSPDYKIDVLKGKIDERKYGKEKEEQFLKIYYDLVKKYNIQIEQAKSETFMDKWYLKPVREEIDFVLEEIKNIKNESTKRVLEIVLSRTVRSCRATTHADLATLKKPVIAPYYCRKHRKICKPIFSIKGWWKRYSIDTLNRISEFDKLRTETFQICLTGDSRVIDIYGELEKINSDFAKVLKNKKIRGIFSSPPYVGLIDYHEQHAYAYEIFGFERKDESEIGPLFKGQGKEARNSYIEGIAKSLINSKKYLQKDYNVFLVANDKFNLYPEIAKRAGMKIVNRYKRPVLNRVEKDRSHIYTETIFHFKEM